MELLSSHTLSLSGFVSELSGFVDMWEGYVCLFFVVKFLVN